MPTLFKAQNGLEIHKSTRPRSEGISPLTGSQALSIP
jgi:hypothetical protein